MFVNGIQMDNDLCPAGTVLFLSARVYVFFILYFIEVDLNRIFDFGIH